LHVVDVVRNEIVHRDHLHRPEIRRPSHTWRRRDG
jgi:hypothetical protein